MTDDATEPDSKWVNIPITRSGNAVPVRLTGERWQHIISRHPEMVDQKNRVCETVSDPDYVQQGDFGELLGDPMEALKILDRPGEITWEYDEEADVLYISAGPPRAAAGIDMGEGLVLRYNEASGEVVGLTLIGLRQRLEQRLPPSSSSGTR